MGCHENHAFSHSPYQFFRTPSFRIQWAPRNILAPMKSCPGGCKVTEIGCRGISLHLLVQLPSEKKFGITNWQIMINTEKNCLKLTFYKRSKLITISTKIYQTFQKLYSTQQTNLFLTNVYIITLPKDSLWIT